MIFKIPTTYKDDFGSVETEIINDYETLTLNVEGVKFESRHFDDFSPVTDQKLPSRFRLNHFNELTNCSLLCRIPIIAVRQHTNIPETLVVNIHLDATEKDYKTHIYFSLVLEGKKINIGETQHFESAFEILKSKLPDNVYLKCCYNCLYADYSFAGSAIFGTMFCFKNVREKYLAVETKDDYMEIFNLHDRSVQEIYLCDSFEPRSKDTGYRG